MAISFFQNVFYFSLFVAVVDISSWIPIPSLNTFSFNNLFFFPVKIPKFIQLVCIPIRLYSSSQRYDQHIRMLIFRKTKHSFIVKSQNSMSFLPVSMLGGLAFTISMLIAL